MRRGRVLWHSGSTAGFAADARHDPDLGISIVMLGNADARRVGSQPQRFVNGDADGFKDAWAHADDVTVAGGFGGEIVQGWNLLSPRLSGAADAYSETFFSTRRIATRATGDFGYVIQHEYFRREETGEPYRRYRVTMLFRQEAGEWKFFHRHADAQMDFRVPD